MCGSQAGMDYGITKSLSDMAFVTRRRRCGQMSGAKPGKTGGVFAGIRRGFFRAENDADGRGSFAAVERSMSGRLLIRVERSVGSRCAFFALPLLQNLLLVERQGIAVAIQHGLGTVGSNLPH